MRRLVIGIEDVVRDRWDSARLDPARLDAAHIDEVAITAGRPDWVAFPWAGRRDAWHPAVGDGDRDPLRDAIARLGAGRRVTVMVDCLAEAWIRRDPSLAAIAPDGSRHPHVVSTAAMEGVVGDRIVELAETVRERYAPDAVTLTEAFLIEAGQERRKAAAIAALAARVGRSGPVEVEVRASWDGPKKDPGPDGQDWTALAAVPARLVVWGYFALHGRPPEALASLDAPADGIVSIGLWGATEQDTIDPATLRAALDAVGERPHAISPASRLSDRHWESLCHT